MTLLKYGIIIIIIGQAYEKTPTFEEILLRNMDRTVEGGRGANCPKASRSKGPHNSQYFQFWGAS